MRRLSSEKSYRNAQTFHRSSSVCQAGSVEREPLHDELRVILVARRHEAAAAVLHDLGAYGDHAYLEVIGSEIAAVAALAEDRWDALLVDGSMEPDRLASTLIQLHGAAGGLPLVVVLGPASIDAAVVAMRLGATDYVAEGNRHRLAAVFGSIHPGAAPAEISDVETPNVISDHMAEVGALAGAAAHEINNPLAVLMGNLDLVNDELASIAASGRSLAESQELAEGLKDAREAAERIRLITADLRTFATSVSGPSRTKAFIGSTDVRRLLDAALRLAWPKIRGRARLVRDTGTKALSVTGQPSALAQLFYNLIVHVADGIPAGDTSANEIRVAVRLDAGGRVLVEVSDAGRGWNAAMVRQMTESFAAPSATPDIGMRLSVCRKVLSDIGARLEISSKPDEGSVIRVVFPLVRTDRADVPTPVPDAEATTRPMAVEAAAVAAPTNGASSDSLTRTDDALRVHRELLH